MVDSFLWCNYTPTKPFLYLFAGRFSHLGAFFGDAGIFGQPFRITLLADFGGSFFGQSVEQ